MQTSLFLNKNCLNMMFIQGGKFLGKKIFKQETNSSRYLQFSHQYCFCVGTHISRFSFSFFCSSRVVLIVTRFNFLLFYNNKLKDKQ